MLELFQQSLVITVSEKLTDKVSPRCDLVKLFIGGACSLQGSTACSHWSGVRDSWDAQRFIQRLLCEVLSVMH